MVGVLGKRFFFSENEILEMERPRDVGCEINNVCNATCSFCGYGKKNADLIGDPRRKSKLPENVLEHTLRLYSEGGGGIFFLGPILGENTADKRWLDFIRTARSYDNITGVSCFTNGILLDKFGYDEILTSGLTNLTISTCLTSKRRYKEIYGVDEFDRVVTNILKLTQRNREMNYPVSIALALRMDKPYKNFLESDLYNSLLENLKKNNIQILDDQWDDYRGLVKSENLPLGHIFKEGAVDKTRPCYALFRKLQVLMDGTIQACSCRVEPELWVGNITEYDTLEAAWRNPKLEKLRNEWNLYGKLPKCCQECTHYIPFNSLISSKLRFVIVASKMILRKIIRK